MVHKHAFTSYKVNPEFICKALIEDFGNADNEKIETLLHPGVYVKVDFKACL